LRELDLCSNCATPLGAYVEASEVACCSSERDTSGGESQTLLTDDRRNLSVEQAEATRIGRNDALAVARSILATWTCKKAGEAECCPSHAEQFVEHAAVADGASTVCSTVRIENGHGADGVRRFKVCNRTRLSVVRSSSDHMKTAWLT